MENIFNNKKGYKRIYIDLPGMGKSSSEKWITNSDIILNIVIALIEKILPNKNFLLAGESYGGYLSRGILYKMTKRIDGIMLICHVIIADNKKRNVQEHVILVKDNMLLSKLTSDEIDDFNSSSVVQNEIIYERYKNEIISRIEIANHEFLRNIKRNEYKFSFDVDKLDGKFNKPALIMVGRQDSCVGYKDSWNILENFPRASFAVLDRAGHNLQIEQEELFNSLVNEWLIRVDES
ncbi:alpha/beta fold hydrolase [Clostridium uliginosum]|uniref:Pimeloyl-ACP methyl ester carboxylesterase n=1 Tax=Clostridium uliginosum TaxID=119641 RepID=A0A1I1NZL9_9CLOT|nr:Pimeloyl-ACP methyl ester carboxylesterase [Clostridium uliginosum]